MASAATSGSRSPTAARGRAEMLYPMAQPKFCTMTAEVEPAIPTAAGTPSRSLPSNATSLWARADSEPLPTAQPTSAAARAGASFDPVTDHHHPVAVALHGLERVQLLRRGQVAADRVDVEGGRHAGDGGGGVTAQDGGRQSQPVQGGDGRCRIGPDRRGQAITPTTWSSHVTDTTVSPRPW